MALTCEKSQLSIFTQKIHPSHQISHQKKVVGEMAQRSMFSFFCTQNFGIFKVFLLFLHTGVGFDVLWFSVVLKMNNF